MRSSKSRSRSKANRPRTLGNIVNRVFDSSGPEGKVRGTPQQIIEKYQTLARDAQLSNDRVAAENFLQHAEHYTRLLAEAMREMAAEQESRMAQQGGQNQWQNRQHDPREQGARPDGGENDFNPMDVMDGAAEAGDISDAEISAPRPQPMRAMRPNGDDRRPNNRPKDNRPRDERPFEERQRQPEASRQSRLDDGPMDRGENPAPVFESPAALVAQLSDQAVEHAPEKPRAPRAKPRPAPRPLDEQPDT